MNRPLALDDLRTEATPTAPRPGGTATELARWRNTTGSKITTGRRPR